MAKFKRTGNGNRNHIPTGTYPARVVAALDRNSDAGNPMTVLTLELNLGDRTRTIDHYVTHGFYSEDQMLDTFGEGCDSDELARTQAPCRAEIGTWDDGRPKVDALLPDEQRQPARQPTQNNWGQPSSDLPF